MEHRIFKKLQPRVSFGTVKKSGLSNFSVLFVQPSHIARKGASTMILSAKCSKNVRKVYKILRHWGTGQLD